MKTLIAVNMNALREVYAAEALGIQKAVEAFAQAHDAKVLDIDAAYRAKTGHHISVPAYPNTALTTVAKEIKAEILAQTGGQLDTLILVGDESAIPMWEIYLDKKPIHTDSFYGDLDGDGLPEVVTTRVLGNPDAMQRQLRETATIGGPVSTILCSEDTRIHLETQRFLDALTQQGHEVAVLGRGGEECLRQSDVIIHFGHGSPQSLSNRFGETFVSAKGMPVLSRHPIAIVDGCATTPPGSALLRAFLNNGCCAYLGSTATVAGMVPARYTNQIVMHFLDVYEAHPAWPVAKLLTAARTKYATVNRLSEVLLEIEQVGGSSQLEGETRTHLLTFLEWHAYGAPYARLHQGEAQRVFDRHSLVKSPVSLKTAEQNSVEASFALKSTDGKPILFLRADWLNSISTSLSVKVQQNGQVLHELQGDTNIIYQHLEDICVGGYVDGDMYHAYWLLPLQREVGQNRLHVEFLEQGGEVVVLPESAINIWPEWETISAPEA